MKYTFLKTLSIIAIIAIIGMFACSDHLTIKIYSIGDSTMADKPQKVYPETGWCQALPQFFDENVIVENHAMNGRSSKSFISEGRWQVVLDSLKEGDYVFIQFGHNDEKKYDSTRYAAPNGLYKENLIKFINETRTKDATPILFTSIARRKFGDDGKLIDTHGDYISAVKELAKEQKVALVDMNRLTTDYINELGKEASKAVYLWAKPTELYPKERKDNTHLSVEGAKAFAGLTLDRLKEIIPELEKHMAK